MKLQFLFSLTLISISAFSQNMNEIILNNAIWNVRLNEPYFLDYQQKDSLKLYSPKETQLTGTLEALLILNEPTNPLDTIKNYILPIHKITFNFGAGLVSIVKYKMLKDNIFNNPKAVIYFKDISWKLKPITELENIRIAIQYLKPESFWAFYNQEKSEIKEIDAIKDQFKDSEGILDIDKLGAYLKTKPPALAKYCDY